MNRTDINPWEWSKAFGFSQAIEVEGAERVLYCSGQTAMGADGTPTSETDMASQVTQSAENLVAVLEAAGMTMADVVKLSIFTTDADELMAAFGSTAPFFQGNLPAMSLFVVDRLAFPELKVEIEAIAAR